MAGGRRFGGSNFTASLQNRRVPCSSEPLEPLFLSGSSPSFFGPRSMVSFEDINGGNRSERPFFHPFDQEHPGDDDLDEHSHHPEKKRRLSGDQVQLLERSFEVENKLEPERKFQLAKNLGLQPRQVAIWFQNRRARWKTKQLEKDYEALQARYNSLKADYDGLHEETERLKAEVLVLTDKLLVKEKQRGNSGIVLPEQNIVDPALKDEASKVLNVVCDLSPAKSDVSESDSPRTVDGGHSSFASNAFEPDQSDVSQDEEDELNMTLLPPHIFPKMEDPDNPSNPFPNSCDFSFPIEDHNAFWSWSY